MVQSQIKHTSQKQYMKPLPTESDGKLHANDDDEGSNPVCLSKSALNQRSNHEIVRRRRDEEVA